MELEEASAVLARTPAVLGALLTDLPAQWLHRDDGPGTWSAYDIVGHILEGDASNWLPRARMIVEAGTARTFEPFDREAMLGRDREPVDTLLDRFRTARAASLAELASLGLTAADLPRRGT